MKLDDKIQVLDNFISLEQLTEIRRTIENGAWYPHKSTDEGMEFLNMDVSELQY